LVFSIRMLNCLITKLGTINYHGEGNAFRGPPPGAHAGISFQGTVTAKQKKTGLQSDVPRDTVYDKLFDVEQQNLSVWHNK